MVDNYKIQNCKRNSLEAVKSLRKDLDYIEKYLENEGANLTDIPTVAKTKRRAEWMQMQLERLVNCMDELLDELAWNEALNEDIGSKEE